MKAALLFLAVFGALAAQTQPAEGNPKAQLRDHLRKRLNAIFETRDTPQGLVARIDGAQFEAGKSILTPAAREKLAQVAGILLAHPGLKAAFEGPADRSGAVRDYLAKQGVPLAHLSLANAAGPDVDMAVSGVEIGAGSQP